MTKFSSTFVGFCALLLIVAYTIDAESCSKSGQDCYMGKGCCDGLICEKWNMKWLGTCRPPNPDEVSTTSTQATGTTRRSGKRKTTTIRTTTAAKTTTDATTTEPTTTDDATTAES